MSFRILKAGSKAALRNIFDKHPMLDGLFAQMLYEPRFRVLFGLALVFLATLPFLLFPLIKASPEGFNPPLRVSGIDLIQAWNLKRTAVKQARSMSFDASVFTWRMAIANNAADADLIRGLLRTVGQAEQPERYADVTVAYSRWLLRLTKTNRFDLELVTSLYEQVGLYDLITATLAERSVVADGPFALSHLKALFYQGDYQRFKLA